MVQEAETPMGATKSLVKDDGADFEGLYKPDSSYCSWASANLWEAT
jgi:hypothetical protein